MRQSLHIDETRFRRMTELLAANPNDFFLSPACRQYFAKDTFEQDGSKVRVFEDVAAGTMPGTVSHNRLQIDDGTFESVGRTLRLINPLTSIQDVFLKARKMKVLSIGPRTEMELLHLVGVGFQPQNISAVDLIATSPWIDLGDMHALPYADGVFDVVISGWVLGYSKDPQKAVDEMLRVVKDGGLIAIGCTYDPDAAAVEYQDANARIQGRIFRKVSEFKKLVGAKLGRVFFQYEPESEQTSAVMMIARVNHNP